MDAPPLKFVRLSLQAALSISLFTSAIAPIQGFVLSPTNTQCTRTPINNHGPRQCISQQQQQQPLPTPLLEKKAKPLFAAVSATQSLGIDEKLFIRESLLLNTMFTDAPENALEQLILKFDKVRYEKVGTDIVRQGEGGGVTEETHFVYLVGENSEFTVTVDGQVVPDPYGTLQQGAMFGDLAVLYNRPRAATVSVKSEQGATLYRIDGDSYKDFVLRRSSSRKDADSSISSPSPSLPEVSLQEMQKIDAVINRITGSTSLYAGNIIPPYQPERLWLWRQWSGTILRVSYQLTFLNMLVCLVFTLYADYATAPPGADDTIVSSFLNSATTIVTPDASLDFNERLSLLKQIWNYQRDLTTFILTFFLNQAFQFWRGIYNYARGVQGRLNDINIVFATNVKRTEDGKLTPESDELLEDIGRYIRLFHILHWASISKSFACLCSPAGLERMASRNKMTARELEILQNSDLPNNRLDKLPMEWIQIRANKAQDEGLLTSDTSTKTVLLQQITKLRATCASIEDDLDGRMPLAYVNLVQILVDSFVLVAPFALYPDLGNYSVFAVGILTLFYTGLLNLAKIFLDPLNNEEFCENSIFMDLGVFIRETNGNTIRWKEAAKEVPF